MIAQWSFPSMVTGWAVLSVTGLLGTFLPKYRSWLSAWQSPSHRFGGAQSGVPREFSKSPSRLLMRKEDLLTPC